MQRKILLSFMLLWAMLTIGIGSAFAQNERTVTGVVKDDTGETLPSATIQIKGTTKGTITDFDGKYSITVPSAETILVYSYIGMEGKEITVGSQTVIDIVLGSSKTLKDVVITSFGIEEDKKTLGYALQTVDSKPLVNSREANIVNALAGKVAGVQINSSGGQAGSSSRITIRGQNSITGNSQPLFVVDGIPIDNSQTNPSTSFNDSDGDLLFTGAGTNRAVDLDPNIVESISVLKGAAATAVWGARGANGVILVTTKKGKKGRPQVTLSSSLILDDAIIRGYQDQFLQGSQGRFYNGLPEGEGGYSEPTGKNGQQIGASWGPNKNNVSDSVLKYVGQPKTYDPRADFFRLGQIYDNTVSISGGFKENYTYRVSYSNRSQQGIAPGNNLNRNNVSIALGGQINKKLSFQGTLNYVNTKIRRLAEGNTASAYMFNLASWPISSDITNYLRADGVTPFGYREDVNNPLWLIDNNSFTSNTNRIISSLSVNYKLSSWLTLTNRFGVDTYSDDQGQQTNVGTIGRVEGRMFTGTAKSNQFDNNLILTANKQLNDNFEFWGTLGHNVNVRNFDQTTLRGIGLGEKDDYDYNNVKQKINILPSISDIRSTSVYAVAKLGYKELFYVEATARNDWFSTLEPGKRAVLYPSISTNTILSELIPALPKSIISYWGVRASYAQAGNAAQPYSTRQLYNRSAPSDATRGSIAVPTQGQTGFGISGRKADPNLTHELKSEFEVGTDIKLFKGTLRADIVYYNSRIKNQIVNAQVSSASGFSESIINGGTIRNKGVEMMITADVFKLLKKSFPLNWEVSVNYSRNRFALEDLAPGISSIYLGGFIDPQIRVDKKYGYGVIWGTRLARNDAGQILIDSRSGLPKLADDLGPIGNTMPKWLGSIRNTLTYKGISLTAFFDGRFGGDIMNLDLNYTTNAGTAKITENRGDVLIWEGVKEDGTPNDIPVITNQAYYTGFLTSVSELFVEDASFVKLRELTLSYSFPTKMISKLKLSSLSLSVTGRNLFIASNFSYFDPEGSLYGSGNAQGFYNGITPGTRSYAFGLNVGF